MKPEKDEDELLYLFMVKAPVALPTVRVFRRNIVNLPVSIDGRTFRARANIRGQADSYALVRGGRHVEIETKSAIGTLREAQERWRDYCDAWGIPYLVLRARRHEAPDETVNRWIDELRAVVEAA